MTPDIKEAIEIAESAVKRLNPESPAAKVAKALLSITGGEVVVVPREPTEEMIKAAEGSYYDVVDFHSLEEDVTAIYKDMIAATEGK